MVRWRTVLAATAVGALLLAACSGDDDDSTVTTAPATTRETDATAAPDTSAAVATTAAVVTTGVPGTTAPAEDAWAVDTGDCDDPAAATAPIGPIVDLGSVMPQTGGVAAVTYAPVQAGFEAYIQFARQQGLFTGYDDVNLTIADDQFDPARTPGAVAGQIAAGADLFAGIIGTPNNEVVRDMLNDQCIPQLNVLTGSPEWGDVADHPWTTGILVPYTVESEVYAQQMGEQFPGGATVGLFSVDNAFGEAYVDAFHEIAADHGLDIVAEQTIEDTDSNPPTSQVAGIAAAQPDVILAVPLGAGCITFLGELATAKAQHPGWDPAVFVTNACDSIPILNAAGAAADGVYTSTNLLDIADPAVQAQPAVQAYIDFMSGLGKGDIATTAAVGWTAAEVTVAILNQAALSAGGLSRASIIDAARHFTFSPSLARAGVVDTSMGEDDPYLSESLQVRQYHAGTSSFTDVGSLVTDFES